MFNCNWLSTVVAVSFILIDVILNHSLSQLGRCQLHSDQYHPAYLSQLGRCQLQLIDVSLQVSAWSLSAF